MGEAASPWSSTASLSGRRNEEVATQPRLMLAASQSSARASRLAEARPPPYFRSVTLPQADQPGRAVRVGRSAPPQGRGLRLQGSYVGIACGNATETTFLLPAEATTVLQLSGRTITINSSDEGHGGFFAMLTIQ
jgi:hypothetical protein